MNFQLKQRLYEAPAYHNNVPVDVSFFGANGQILHQNFSHSGALSSHNFSLNFAPVAVLASYSGGLLTATGVDHLNIAASGAQGAAYSPITINCDNYVDSGSVILMQHLVKAEKQSANAFDFRLASQRYFTIQKIGLAQSTLKGEIRFEGSNGKGFITIKNKGTDPDVFVQIFNQRGSLEMVKSFNKENHDKMQIDLGSLKAGQYVIKINEYRYQLLKL